MSHKTIQYYKVFVRVLGIAYITYHIISAELLLLPGLGSRFIHINGALLLSFMTIPLLKRKHLSGWAESLLNLILTGGTIASGVYIFVMSPELMSGGIGGEYKTGIALGLITVVLVLEANRRLMGLSIVLIVVGGLLYARFGEIMPSLLVHIDFGLERIMTLLYLGTDGLYGMIARVSFSYIALFVIYAEFLRTSGGGDFFLDLSYSLTGKIRGGPAKAAVVGSCLFGSISGSAVANVAGTGAVTIPLMKKTGYPPEYAAAVEAAASTGGQFMPPIMGASAFLVADFCGIDYINVALAAFIPAVLYYLALFVMIDVRAVKGGLKGLPKEELPDLKSVLKKGYHHLLSLIVLIYLLAIARWTPTRAAFWSIVAILFIAIIKREKKFFSGVLLPSMESSVKGVVMMGVVSGALGIIVGIFGLTGLALKLSTLMIDVADGNLLLLLMLTMLASIFLGMGLPTVAAYVLLAMLVAPALEQIGVPLLAGHLFCLFFGILSVVTPPVCLASYTAATIADSNPMKTGLRAFQLCLPGFLLPYVFVYSPSLLFINPSVDMIWPILTSIIGVCGVAFAQEGYFYGKLSPLSRILVFLGSIGVIIPQVTTDAIGFGVMAIGLGPALWRRWRLKQKVEV